MSKRTLIILLAANLVVAAPPASAAPPPAATTATRTGNHGAFGRVVFDLPPGAEYNTVTEGDRMLVVFQGAGSVLQPGDLPPNVLSLKTGTDMAAMLLAPGTLPRAVRFGDRLVIDISNGPKLQRGPPNANVRPGIAPVLVPGRTGPHASNGSADSGASASRPQHDGAQQDSGKAGLQSWQSDRKKEPPISAPAIVLGPVRSASSDEAGAGRAAQAARSAADSTIRSAPLPSAGPSGAGIAEIDAVKAAPRAAPVAPVLREPLPAPEPSALAVGDVAKRSPEPAPREIASPLLVRAAADVGVAALQRGDEGVIVFDRRIPVPLAPAGGIWTTGAVSTTLQLTLATGEYIDLERVAEGWIVRRLAERPTSALQPSPLSDGVSFGLKRPGRAITILDPVTGGPLLVGTSLDVGTDVAVADLRRTPDYTILPTVIGVVIEPSSDHIDFHPTRTGFLLSGGSTVALSRAPVGSRRFEFSDQPLPMLLNRLRAQLTGAAASAPRARTRDRVAAAQTMLALGMGAEAQSLMQLVVADDPQAAADAEVLALGSMAAVLAGRVTEAEGLDDPRLDGTDEMALWRGFRDRRLGRDTPAARHLATVAPLAMAYPAPLKNLIWPEAAEVMAEQGLPLADDVAPGFARALQLEHAGKIEEALTAFDEIAAGQNRLDQVRASARAAELRLSAGQLTPGAAAAVLERQSFAWRGDARELGLRMRAAELRGAAGEWRAALDALRVIEAQFPDQHAGIQSRKAAVLQAMLQSEGNGLSPLELVLLAAENADGVPESLQGGVLAKLLADKLLALDLPARAIPVLQGLMQAAPAGEPRAELGMRLAQLLLDGNDATAAVTALKASASADLSPALRESRAMLGARARAAQGDIAGASAGLFELGTAAADELRADVLEGAGDWRGCLAALTDLVAKQVPSDGALNEAAQLLLLRQASAAARVPDPAMLHAMERYATRMTAPRSDLFRLLTAGPVSGTADLPRAAQELKLARALPEQLSTIVRR